MSTPERSKPEKAVALKYETGLPAPFLLAKASGRGAERLKAAAAKAHVTVLRDEALAESLYPLNIGDYVPEKYFEVVARVFAFVKRVEES